MKLLIYILIVIFTITNETARASTQTVSNIHIKTDNMNTTTKVQEIWKTIPNNTNYKVSDIGNLKSINRIGNSRWGKASLKGKILNQHFTIKGYKRACLNGSKFLVHQLVAIAFLNHKPEETDLVVNHINFDKSDNRLKNLEIITNRENCNKKHIESVSKYVGVDFMKGRNKWRSRISINNKQIHLGFFNTELEASGAYQNKLKQIE